MFIGLNPGFKTLHFQCSTLVLQKIYCRKYIVSYGQANAQGFTYGKPADVPLSVGYQIALSCA